MMALALPQRELIASAARPFDGTDVATAASQLAPSDGKGRSAMKLYYSPGACSLHPQIALREAGLPFDLVRVDMRAHRMAGSGDDYYAVNPKGYVPTLELDDGTRLTEGAVIDQYIADQKPDARLIPRPGTLERYRAQEWLNFIATEVHKQFSPIFSPATPDAIKEQQRQKIAGRFDLIEKTLATQPYLLGDTFSIADAYLYNVLRWTEYTGIDRSKWPALVRFFERVQERPSVKAALEAERSPK
jgi:glutathione S-transferase